MNDLLQKHGCSNVFSIPEGLKELMSDITREVLREQPPKLYEFIANYLSCLLITREHGIMAVKVLDDLCDCQPSVSEHLIEIGLERSQAKVLAEVIKEQIESLEPDAGKEKVRELLIVKQILAKATLDEEMAAKVIQVTRNAFKDYWYRKRIMQKSLTINPEEPWEVAAQRTLLIYKRTRPSFSELSRATERIQAAYRGYHVRKNLLDHLQPKLKPKPKLELPGPPLDVAGSREIDLGPIINVKVKPEDVKALFKIDAHDKLGLKYDPMLAITHVEANEDEGNQVDAGISRFSVPKAIESRLLNKALLENVGSLQERLNEHAIPLTPTVSEESMQKTISFARVPAEVIPDPIPEAEVDEIQDLFKEEDIGDKEEEVPEDIAGQEDLGDQERMEGLEAVQEVPEDLTDGEQSEPEGVSEPTPTVTSAPDADATDVEDVGDMATSGEEEGE